MPKKLVIVSLLFLLTFPLVTSAVIDFGQPGDSLDIQKVIPGVLNFIWALFGGVAVLMFIFAGFLFLTANGDPSKAKLARAAVLWGVIGVIVAILAFSVLGILREILGVG